MNEQNKPAPVWRLLEPGEIIREGDRIFARRYKFNEPDSWQGTLLTGQAFDPDIHRPIARRMEPDPVKAELLAALRMASVLLFKNSGRLVAPNRSDIDEVFDAMRAAIAKA